MAVILYTHGRCPGAARRPSEGPAHVKYQAAGPRFYEVLRRHAIRVHRSGENQVVGIVLVPLGQQEIQQDRREIEWEDQQELTDTGRNPVFR